MIPYVERGGEQVFRGPFLQSGTDYRGFAVRADRDRLAALCDRLFTRPTAGAVRVRPLGDTVLVSFAKIARISSLDPLHALNGTMPEVDVAFWVPVEVEVTAPGGQKERSVAWIIPYIFVDEPIAVATGREHYGFPKGAARVEMPTTIRAPGAHRVEAMALEHLGPDVTVTPRPLVEVTPDGPAPSLGEALGALGALFGTQLDGAALASLTSFLAREMPVLFLRQLRDVADPTRAAFAEVLLAPIRTRTVREAGLERGGFTLRLHAAASHPIAADLGMKPVTPVSAAFHMDFDFEMGLGRTLWARAGGDALPGGRGEPKRRIAVLGGGIAALTAVHALTAQPGWDTKYDITVYQMGFRLGGKGASGRNADAGQRIEEHGLHVWFGFYENAFRLMRGAYAELGRASGTPLATWQEAFAPHDHVVVQEQVNGAWVPWSCEYPRNDALPGDPSPEQSPLDLARHLARWSNALLEEALITARPAGGGRVGSVAFAALSAGVRIVQKLALRAVEDPAVGDSRVLTRLSEARRKLQVLVEAEVERDTTLRRTWISVDWALTNLYGMLRDGVLERGFEAIDAWDYCAWLRRHGASEMTLRSAPIRSGYDLVFGFEGGDPERPNFAAGVGLYGFLRLFFTYKGAFAYMMQGGMGDVVFTPLYEVLKRRGVRFAFFHKVEELGLSADGTRIGSIRVARQATVKAGEYAPLVDVKGMACWPDRPRYDQLVEGEALRGVDLESGWNGWAPVERRTLIEGVDFDEVILGIPVAALRTICKPLVEARPEWRAMVDNVATVATHAFQLWTTADLRQLGWRSHLTDAPPLLGAYVEPTDTWSDMTHLVPVEDWPAEHTPGHIAYFCGPMRDPEAYPEATDTAFPARERARTLALARQFLDEHVHRLWPEAVDGDGRFRDALLVDLDGRAPAERLARQLLKANVEPTDRYTMSPAGSIRHRLRADGSGFANLHLTGDWTDNGFNGGCIEAAVMSGLYCARSVLAAVPGGGEDVPIHGENPRLRPGARPG